MKTSTLFAVCGIVCGLTGASTRATIVRAACESMAYQSYDVLRAMEQDVGLSIERLSVDGGASRNEFIMQFQADLLDIPVLQCETVETTAIGAAYLAGLAVGYWEDLEELEQNAQIRTVGLRWAARYNKPLNLCMAGGGNIAVRHVSKVVLRPQRKGQSTHDRYLRCVPRDACRPSARPA